ncbi:hypothetical protein Fmac_023732 [Flemingia macrophylla]|uniref:F-box domain-containing protein n=1 Tax=Flemingia macrophylla TaxID=520843 RepID=A0ABD1LMB7_9FABA
MSDLVSPASYSSPSFPVLPDELILKILHRVLVRSLLRFKCVCKSWNAIISDPEFANDHLCTSIADPNMTHHRLVSSNPTEPPQIISFSVQSLFQNPPTGVEPQNLRMSLKYHIVGSCNGLLCLFEIYQGYFKLWNPSTGLKSERLSIGVFPDVIITYHGFGYDHVNHKYKVLAVVENAHETLTKIYSFGSNASTVIQAFPCDPTRMQGKFVSGTLNWIAEQGASDDQWLILSLDMVSETYSEILLPDEDEEKIYTPVLHVLRNCLCVCFFESKSAHWILWLMKDYGVQNSWTKLMMVPHVGREISAGYHLFEPLCIAENGVVLLKTTSANLVLFDPNDGRLNYLRIRGEIGFNMLIYHESLVSPQC